MLFAIKPIFISSIIVLTGCTNPGTTAIPEKTITADYRIGGGTWQTGETLIIAFKAFEQDDLVSLCGAYAFDKRNGFGGSSFHDLALRASSIEIDDNELVNDLSFMNQVSFPATSKTLKGKASCVLTEVPWQRTYGYSVRPKMIRNRRNFSIRN